MGPLLGPPWGLLGFLWKFRRNCFGRLGRSYVALGPPPVISWPRASAAPVRCLPSSACSRPGVPGIRVNLLPNEACRLRAVRLPAVPWIRTAVSVLRRVHHVLADCPARRVFQSLARGSDLRASLSWVIDVLPRAVRPVAAARGLAFTSHQVPFSPARMVSCSVASVPAP